MSTTNIDNGGTLLQRAARLEQVAKVNLVLEAGADPGALAEDDDLNPDDNVQPILIAIKKNNWTIYGNIRRKMYKYEYEAYKYYEKRLNWGRKYYTLGKTDIKLLRLLLTCFFFSFSPGFTWNA